MLLLRRLASTPGFNPIVASNGRKQRVSPVLSPDHSQSSGAPLTVVCDVVTAQLCHSSELHTLAVVRAGP